MCTVTFIPTANNSFILTSNRDEHISRLPSLSPVVNIINGTELLFPKDGNASGTWIAASQNGRLVCLLNGAFVKHNHQPPYKKSRGLVVLESFDYEAIIDFKNNYDFKNIEPFTLIVCETKELALFEFRWDGVKTHLQQLPIKNTIWSSSTLYDTVISQQRKQWFEEWFTANDVSPESIKKFHTEGGSGSVENNFKMKRPSGMQTVSTTQVVFGENNFTMEHDNFSAKTIDLTKLVINVAEIA